VWKEANKQINDKHGMKGLSTHGHEGVLRLCVRERERDREGERERKREREREFTI